MPAIGDRVTLDEAEQRLAIYVATRRFQACREQGKVNMKCGHQTYSEAELQGVASELAFCRLFNVYPDLTLYNQPDHDAVIMDGQTVDVKTTERRDGHMLISPWKRDAGKADLYALVVGSFPGPYEYRGLIHRRDAFRPEWLRNPGRGTCYMVPQDALVAEPPRCGVLRES